MLNRAGVMHNHLLLRDFFKHLLITSFKKEKSLIHQLYSRIHEKFSNISQLGDCAACRLCHELLPEIRPKNAPIAQVREQLLNDARNHYSSI